MNEDPLSIDHGLEPKGGKKRRLPVGPPAEPVAATTENLPLALLSERAADARKTFADIEELAASIRDLGVLEPICVRPMASGPTYEIVYGRRRYRAAKLAGLTKILCMVRELDERQADELALTENLQRKDLTPLEEADAYRWLLEEHHLSIEEIAAKAGRSVSTVTLRLRLCALAPAARRALEEDRIGVAAALELTRLAGEAQQTMAIEKLLKNQDAMGEQITLSEARWLVRDLSSSLRSAPFDVADATLVPHAGGCGSCPKRTSVQATLFGDLDRGEDCCTDESCFSAKRDAAAARIEAEAAEKGHVILPDSEAKKLFPYGSSLPYGSPYVDLDERDYDTEQEGLGDGGDLDEGHQDPPGARLPAPLKAAALAGADVPIVLAKDSRGTFHRLVTKSDFAAVTGRPPEPTRSASPHDAKKEREKAKKKAEAFALELADLVDAAEQIAPTQAWWRTLARTIVRTVWEESRKGACKRRKLEPQGTKKAGHVDHEKLLLDAASIMSEGECRGLIVELLATMGRGDPTRSFKELREATPKDLPRLLPAKGPKLLPAPKAASKSPAKATSKKKARKG